MIKQRLMIPKDCFWFYISSDYFPCHISPFLETCSKHTGEVILMTYGISCGTGFLTPAC